MAAAAAAAGAGSVASSPPGTGGGATTPPHRTPRFSEPTRAAVRAALAAGVWGGGSTVTRMFALFSACVDGCTDDCKARTQFAQTLARDASRLNPDAAEWDPTCACDRSCRNEANAEWWASHAGAGGGAVGGGGARQQQQQRQQCQSGAPHAQVQERQAMAERVRIAQQRKEPDPGAAGAAAANSTPTIAVLAPALNAHAAADDARRWSVSRTQMPAPGMHLFVRLCELGGNGVRHSGSLGWPLSPDVDAREFVACVLDLMLRHGLKAALNKAQVGCAQQASELPLCRAARQSHVLAHALLDLDPVQYGLKVDGVGDVLDYTPLFAALPPRDCTGTRVGAGVDGALIARLIARASPLTLNRVDRDDRTVLAVCVHKLLEWTPCEPSDDGARVGWVDVWRDTAARLLSPDLCPGDGDGVLPPPLHAALFSATYRSALSPAEQRAVDRTQDGRRLLKPLATAGRSGGQHMAALLLNEQLPAQFDAAVVRLRTYRPGLHGALQESAFGAALGDGIARHLLPVVTAYVLRPLSPWPSPPPPQLLPLKPGAAAAAAAAAANELRLMAQTMPSSAVRLDAGDDGNAGVPVISVLPPVWVLPPFPPHQITADAAAAPPAAGAGAARSSCVVA